jgi:hypothetical protein
MVKQQEADAGTGQNGREEEVAKYEQELAGYLQERIKPGLNSGAIPLLARSIAKEIAHREHPNGAVAEADAKDGQTAEADGEQGAEAKGEQAAEADGEQAAEADGEQAAEADGEETAEAEDEHTAEADDEKSAEADDEPSAEAEDEESGESESTPPDFEADMHELQAELGEDWILRFSVQGDDAWLTAEKDDGSQRVEAATASVLSEAVELLNESGGRQS